MKKYVFILQYINKVSPFRIGFEILLNVFKQLFNVYYGVFFLRLLLVGLEKDNYAQIIQTLLFMLVLNTFFWLLKKYYDNIYSLKFKVKLKQKLYCDLSRTIKEIPYEEYNEPRNLDKCTRVLEKTEENIEKFVKSIGSIAGYLFALTMIALYISSIDYKSLIFSIIPLLFSVVLEAVFSKFNFKLSEATTRSNREKNYVKRVFYLSEYSKELKITSIYKELIKIYEEGCNKNIKNIKKYGKFMAMLKAIGLVFGDAFIVIAALIYAFLKFAKSENFFLGDFIGLSQAITYFNWDISGLVDSLSDYFQSLPFLNDFYKLISSSNNIKEKKLKLNPPFFIEFKNVSFSYNNQINTIDNCSISINPGQKIAIVGENGSGKSTFVKLLLGVLKPTKGEILFNGKSIDEYNPSDLYANISVLFQDFSIYPFSFKDNITLGSILSERKIMSEMKEIGLDKKIESLNQELTKEFDNNGLVLSGGQNQMMAFLRIAVKDSSLIILDEPTSALDAFAEEKLYKYITQKFSNATIVFISHKLSSTSFVDNIIFLENGRIIESGTHSELLNKKGKYNELYLMQAKRYYDKTEA